MAKIIGNTKFLNHSQIKKLEKLFKRKLPPDKLITINLANIISKISFEIKKQIGVVVDRKGKIHYIIIGDEREILWPTFLEFSLNKATLREITAIHTHLHGEGLDYDDLSDLAYIRFDFLCCLNINEKGLPEKVSIGGLRKDGANLIFSKHFYDFDFNFFEEILKIETELSSLKKTKDKNLDLSKERVILVHADNKSKYKLIDDMEELKELAKAANYQIVDTVIQRINKSNPSYILGKGKFKELIVKSIENKIDKIIFYNELTPTQAKEIAALTEIEVIDRTILILNIFARRALSKEGKLKIELARLKYLSSRVSDKAEALSRIRGGIGLRGPGETKAEIERRRIKERIKVIQNELKKIEKTRLIQRRKRERNRIPVISIIGYTNAGKSTLLNTLTNSSSFVEDLMFATLDTFSRKLRLPNGKYLILNDTVGFIKNLPKDLIDAFKSTLEELRFSDCFIHLVDISDENFELHIKTVEKILKDIGADDIKKILVFNKIDKINEEMVNEICRRYNAIGISAKNKIEVYELIEELEFII